jgi:putative endonuclease
MGGYVYILTNKSHTLYVGSTQNLILRVKQHFKKKSPGFTAKYNLNKLIYYQWFDELKEAQNMERKIKGWIRQKKMDLVKTQNPTFSDLLLDLSQTS